MTESVSQDILPLKDWCRDCQWTDRMVWCLGCCYKILREQVVAQPPHFKRKVKA